MVVLTAGTVVLVSFPFSDLSQSKLRPAVVLANANQEDWILCQVTSKSYSDLKAIEIRETDFSRGSLQKISYVRPCKLFTAHHSICVSELGKLKSESLQKIIAVIIDVLQSSSESPKTIP